MGGRGGEGRGGEGRGGEGRGGEGRGGRREGGEGWRVEEGGMEVGGMEVGREGVEGGGRNVMAIMEWVHIAWNGCVKGNTSEAAYPASLQ